MLPLMACLGLGDGRVSKMSQSESIKDQYKTVGNEQHVSSGV